MNYLDFLIQDCLREYAEDYIPSTIDAPTAQSARSDKSIYVLEETLFDIQPFLISPVSPVVAMSLPVLPAQSNTFIDIPFGIPMLDLYSCDSLEIITSVSSVEDVASEAPNNRFNCAENRITAKQS
jgi:hypothetical protein